MTENMKKFLEEVSEDKEFINKVNKAETPEAVIAITADITERVTAKGTAASALVTVRETA